MAVDVHSGHVLSGVRQVVKEVIGVFSVQKQAVSLGKLLLERCLKEETVVPLAVLVAELPGLFPDRRSGISSFRVVEIGLHLPVAAVCYPEQAQFHSFHPHVSVSSGGCSVVAAFGGIGETVAPGSVHIFSRSAESQPVCEFSLPQKRRVQQSERACLEAH